MPAVSIRRRLAVLVPAAAVAACVLPATAAACENTTALPGATDPAALAATTICLVNEERARAGLAPVVAQPELTKAAAAHAGDMVARDFFAHESPDGGTLLDRLHGAGWVPASGGWTAGENIAWGTGSLASPERIVAAWMGSPGHRANILRAAFDEVGMAIVAAAPGQSASVAGTYVSDFGARDDARAPATQPAAAPAPRAKAKHHGKRRAKSRRAREARRAAARARARR